SVVGIKIFALGFQHPQRPTLTAQNVVGTPGGCVQFKTHLARIEQIPAGEFERLVDEHTRECLGGCAHSGNSAAFMLWQLFDSSSSAACPWASPRACHSFWPLRPSPCSWPCPRGLPRPARYRHRILGT